MGLLEREEQFAGLGAALAEATAGRGQVVLVSGEAGIGKTSLVDAFTRQHRANTRVLRGSSDPLITPHPLCVLHDIARQLPESELGEMLWGTDRIRVYHYCLEQLQLEPTIMVLEDIHWADEATLEMLNFLSRRIQRMTCLIVATYRDDTLAPEHPLWLTLGHLTAPHIHRIALPPLSRGAVSAMQQQAGRHIPALYESTAGNPFFVSEMLASDSPDLPRSISEAVLARTANLSAEARGVVELTAVIPKERFELSLLTTIWDLPPDVLEECEGCGLIHLDGSRIRFRHELARQAIIDALSPMRRRMLNLLVLQTLIEKHNAEGDVSRSHIVHHARAAGDAQTLAAFAPLAAEEAKSLGAHREAVAHYRALLEVVQDLPQREQAELWEALAYECYLTGQIADSIAARQRALEIWRAEGSALREGDTLRWLSRLEWFRGDGKAATDYADAAIRVLEPLPPGPELAMATSNRAQLYMLSREHAEAVALGGQAIELAEQFDAPEVLVHALNNVGTAEWALGEDAGEKKLERSLHLALAHNFEEHAARAYTNASCRLVELRRYDEALELLGRGIEYTISRDLDSWTSYMRGWRARAAFEHGDWAAAQREAAEVQDTYRGAAAILRLPALITLAQLAVRQGDANASVLLKQARALAQKSGELQRVGPVALAAAEAAWLRGELDTQIEELGGLYEQALAHDRLLAEMLAYWLHQAGALTHAPAEIGGPVGHYLRGDWLGAADAWAKLGCPYEQALMLAEGDDDARREALAIFERLGAAPAADWLRGVMRANGRRGPRPTTLSNPAGLTNRQVEVLGLLVEGLSDAEIGDALYISAKTASHHVSAILGKLGVRSRQEAAVLAVQAGWFATERDEVSLD